MATMKMKYDAALEALKQALDERDAARIESSASRNAYTRVCDEHDAYAEKLRYVEDERNAARTEATQQRAFSAQMIDEHSKALAAKEQTINELRRQGKDARMQILKLLNRSSVDKQDNAKPPAVTGVVVSHRTPAMQAAFEEAQRTGKSVAVK